MSRLSKIGSYVISSRSTVTLTACGVLFVVALAKFSIVRAVLRMGAPREVLQAQDALITAVLSAVLVWVVLMAVRARREQEQQQIRTVADLNHHLRNALEIILCSAYLRQSEHATAILHSVERIDHTLKMLLPAGAKQNVGGNGLPAVKEFTQN